MAISNPQSQKLGSLAPGFTLQNTVNGEMINLASAKGMKGTLIMFICNHCPYVVNIAAALSGFAKDFQSKGISTLAISSNDVENYPDDSPELMAENARENDYTFPYLFDETQEVARANGAMCTPEFFLYDDELRLVYHGQFDDSRPGNGITPSGKDLRSACEDLLLGNGISIQQIPSVGCGIKWK